MLHSQRFTYIWTLPLGSIRVFKKFPSLHPSLTYIIAVTFYVYILNPMWLFVCIHCSLRFILSSSIWDQFPSARGATFHAGLLVSNSSRVCAPGRSHRPPSSLTAQEVAAVSLLFPWR